MLLDNRKQLTYSAAALNEIGLTPGGQLRTFCEPVYNTSMPVTTLPVTTASSGQGQQDTDRTANQFVYILIAWYLTL